MGVDVASGGRRIEGFDGIRGIAALSVVFHHTVIYTTHIGDVSVYVFFGLSGYLIIGILMQSRASIESHKSTLLAELNAFWTNRVVRIFPVYYLVLVSTLIIALTIGGYADLRENFLWYLLYAQNFLIGLITRHWGSFTHSWSLAVEQQFYVVFSFALILLPRKFHGHTLLLAYAACATALFAMVALHANDMALYVLPFGGFLFILSGGIVTFLRDGHVTPRAVDSRIAEAIGWGLLALLAALSCMPASGVWWSDYFELPTPVVMIFLTVVIGAFLWLVASFPGLTLVRFLERSLFKFLGSISYALYVLHYPIAWGTHWILMRLQPLPHHMAGMVWFALTLIPSVGLSTLSRQFIERPLARLKKRWREAPAVSLRTGPVPLDGAVPQ